VLATADDAEQLADRRPVQPALAAGRVAGLRERAQAFVQRGGDHLAAVANPLPSEAVSRLLGLL
jgi:hypothetical protein